MININMPNRTIVHCGSAAVLSVALTSWLHIRPLGVLFLILFTFWIYHTQCNVRIISPPQLVEKYKRSFNYLSEMRRNRTAMFYALSSGALFLLAIAGHLVSDSTIVLIVLLFTIFITAKYKFKMTRIKEKGSEQYDVDMETFLPEVNDSNLFVLDCASTLTSLSSNVVDDDDKSDEIPTEFLLPDKLPDINENNTDDDEDLVPVIEKKKISNTTSAMAFKKGHFKRDSSISTTSSSSEESLSKGPQFPDHTEVDCLKTIKADYGSSTNEFVGLVLRTQTQAFLANSGNILPSVMTGIVQWGIGAVTANSSSNTPTATSVEEIPNTQITNKQAGSSLDSSDESDFEILENEDFKQT